MDERIYVATAIYAALVQVHPAMPDNELRERAVTAADGLLARLEPPEESPAKASPPDDDDK